MGRVDKYRQLRYQLIDERDGIKQNFNIIYEKLDDISSRLEEISKHLYEYAKSDNCDYSKIFDEQMGDPMQELERLFEVKKCQ